MKGQSKQELVATPTPPNPPSQSAAADCQQQHLPEPAQVIIKTACKVNTGHNKYKGEMSGVAVFDWNGGVWRSTWY